MHNATVKYIMAACAALLLITMQALAAQPEDAADVKHAGTVLEFQIAGNYAYLRLDVEGNKVWIATMPNFLRVTLSKGDKVEYSGGVLMSNFQSKAMNRTFKSIFFITKIKVLEKNSIKVPDDTVHSAPETAVQAIAPAEGDIERARGGKTVEEIFAEREKLKDTAVSLQAKVMKINSNILKRNWITLQDGTGEPPDDKIVFTTTGTSHVNDIVNVKGIVRTDVSLGGNYNYKVLLEDVNFPKK